MARIILAGIRPYTCGFTAGFGCYLTHVVVADCTNRLRLRMAFYTFRAYRTSVGLDARVLARGLCCYLTAVPSVRSSFGFLAYGAYVLVLCRTRRCPFAVFMVVSYGNCFRLRCLTVGAGVGLNARVLTRRLCCYNAAVPSVRSGFY